MLLGIDAGLHGGVAERQADRVEAQRLHLVHHALVAAGPQAVDDAVARLEAEPVDAGDSDRRFEPSRIWLPLVWKKLGPEVVPGAATVTLLALIVGGSRGGGAAAWRSRNRHAVQRVVGGAGRQLAGRGVEAEVHAAAVRDGAVVAGVLEDVVRAGVARDRRVPDVGDREQPRRTRVSSSARRSTRRC